MERKVVCPGCRKALRIRDSFTGRMGLCPHCGRHRGEVLWVVPNADEPQPIRAALRSN